jgi:TP901 family phage tail tape measure protein
MASVSEIWVKINSDISGLQRGLLASGTELKAFSATTTKTAATTTASAAKVETAYGGIGGTVQKLGPVFIAAGAAAVTGIVKGIQATQQWAGEVKTLQRVTGQSAEDASRLATAADTLGISTSTLATSFGLLGKNIINGSANLEKYGVVTKDAEGKTLPFNDILGNIQDKFATLPKGIEQATFAQNVFGRGGKALIPILAQGRAGLAALESAADKYGTTLSQKDLDASRALTIAQKELGDAFKGAEISIARDFIPVLTSAVQTLTSVVEVIHKIPQPIISAGLAFVTLAGGAAAAGKVIGFLTSGWESLGNTLGITSKLTETTTAALDENTAATVANATAQGSLAVEANSVSNAVSTAADVIDAGTKATEASTTAVTTDIAAQAAHTAAQKGTIAANTAQLVGQQALFDATVLGTGAVGDLALAQGALFDATTTTTGAIVAEGGAVKALGVGSAGIFSILNAGIASTAAVLFGLAKEVGFAKEAFTGYFRVLVEGQSNATNVNQALGATSKAMQFLGFAVPGVTDNVGDFTKAVEDVQAGLQDGTITIDAARGKIADLADQYGISNLNVDLFTKNLADSVGVVDKAAEAAVKHTRAMQAQGVAIGDLASHSKTATSILDLMGESAAQFGTDARKAFQESDQAFRKWATDFRASAADAWNQFRDSAKTSITFTTSMLQDLESSAKSAQDTLAGDTSGLSKGALANLRAQAHLTATDILHTFQAAKAKTISFSKDLIEIGKVGGQAGKDLAASFLAAGDVLAAQVVADAPKKLQDKIVGAFGASEKAADSFSTKLTNAIVGPLEDISGLLEAIARHFGIDVSFLDHGAKHDIDAINTSLKAVAGHHRGEVDLDTSRALAALTTLIARERQAGVSSGNLDGRVTPRQIVGHSGGLVTQAGVRKFHSGGAVKRMHAGGAVAGKTADSATATSSYGVRPPPNRNGQMWMGWTGGSDNAHPVQAMGWWNNRLNGRYVQQHTNPSLHVAADLGPNFSKKYLGYTDFNLRNIHLNPIIKTVQDPAWNRVLRHEMGHGFGLGHVTNPSNLMDRDLTGDAIDAAQAKQIKKWFHPPTMHAGGLAADEVPAVLQVGEFVVQRRAVEHIGLSNLFAMNQMHTGGAVVPPGASPVGVAGIDEAALERAFRKALRAERGRLYVDRRRFGRDLDEAVLTDGHW